MKKTGAKESPNNLHNRLVTSLKSRILQWEYPPGFRLFEQDVCDEYKVSRSPAREAFRTLEADGYLEKTPRKGYLVKQPSTGTAREMYEVRLALELSVVEHLASSGDHDPRIDELHDQWGSSAQCARKSSDEFAILDRTFHETLAEVVGNKTLLEYLGAIDERLHVFRIIEFLNEDTRRTTCTQHLDILNAIAGHDVPGAQAALRKNIMSAIDHVEGAIKEALARSYLHTGRDDG